ncbi:MAG: hypothetical protein MK077_07485 [Phycisphaerales bacterium]|nr:hypothetical protein [Phycisphaerales bacterium]
MDHAGLLSIAVEAAQSAASVLSEHWSTDAGICGGVGKDIKTQADLAAEQCLLEHLRPTGLSILSEEQGADDSFDLDAGGWIIDPLDGTMNFTRGIPITAVSVGFWQHGQPVLGVVVDIDRQLTFQGIVGQGATCQGKPIGVSDVQDPSDAILATGFPRARAYDRTSLQASLERIQSFKKVRMVGSATMSLAWTACGMMDLYHEEDIFLWDVAAGLALVRAAGGRAHWTPPSTDWKTTVYAGTAGLVHDAVSVNPDC